ncbi:ATP-dependent DNA helicase [Aliivibrio finisterrensis]|uniref:AAA family ATPase n=1 Tax=Aliivibrio finisterrensis TaxID=511998 RepID=A0A6N6RWD6_9GAMM|nr:AAA family ATPase [Aliivibrio finisterrensis]KAB2825912.1 AAA family ATPase [Aliivibrio finisterrensis]
MKRSNFSFLGSDYSKLQTLGEQAENNVYCDPQTAAFKLRAYSELLTEYIFHHLQIEVDSSHSFLERLRTPTFIQSVPQEILSKLHAVRKQGNKAVHNEIELMTSDALWLLEECYLVGHWFIQTMQGSYVFVPTFVTPVCHDNTLENLRLDNTKLQSKVLERAATIKQTEAELEQLKEELKQRRSERLSTEAAEESIREFQRSGRDAASSIDLKMEQTRARVSIHDEFADIKLTNDQQRALNSIETFINNPQSDVFILHGYAGTGKTFITKGVVNYLTNLGMNSVLLSPTGKAAKVLSDKTNQNASTIHSAIYDFRDCYLKDEHDDRLPVAPVKQNFNSDDTVYIVDEASMIADIYSCTESVQFGSGFLLKDLVDFSQKVIGNVENNIRRKIIFIGDNAQLPPVGMKFSPALSNEYLAENYQLKVIEETLKEVVRQESESGVLDNATMLRKAIEKNVFNQLEVSSVQSDVESVESEQFIEQFMQLCNGTVAQTKQVMLIGSSNRIVAGYNKQCREHFFPGALELCAGDKIISVANHYRNDIDVTNGDFGLIRQILSGVETKWITFNKKVEGKTEKITVELAFRDVEVVFRDKLSKPKLIRAKVMEKLLYTEEPSLSADESRALNVDFLKRHPELTRKGNEEQLKAARKSDPYLNAFRVKFGYAITCHKAQGSEWEHVLVNCKSHQSPLCQDYFRWLYTAITRTSKALYVINEPKIKIGGNTTIVGENILKAPISEEVCSIGACIEELNRYGIAEKQAVLVGLLGKVKGCLDGSQIEIVNIDHYQYQERYTLKRGNSTAEVQFNYNGKNKISSMQVKSIDDLSSELEMRLGSIVGSTFFDSLITTSRDEFQFDEEFLSDFYQRVREVFTPHEIDIASIDQKPWNQRYAFSHSSEAAVVDFYYNGKQQFTKVIPMPQLSGSKALLSKIIEIWSES